MDKYFKNKNTGEIGSLSYYEGVFRIIFKGSSRRPKVYDSLSEFVEAGWEDYEGPAPKEYWYIYGNHVLKNKCDGFLEDKFKEIGNYFETKEEAEKAVEKLKAFKRLKDKGFRFRGIGRTVYDIDCAEFDIGSEYLRERDLRGSELNKDLDLLFGGEE